MDAVDAVVCSIDQRRVRSGPVRSSEQQLAQAFAHLQSPRMRDDGTDQQAKPEAKPDQA